MAPSMHPYRELPVLVKKAPRLDPEELILYGLLMVIGAIPVLLAVGGSASFGVDASVGLLMVCAGAVGAIAYGWRARKSSTR